MSAMFCNDIVQEMFIYLEAPKYPLRALKLYRSPVSNFSKPLQMNPNTVLLSSQKFKNSEVFLKLQNNFFVMVWI